MKLFSEFVGNFRVKCRVKDGGNCRYLSARDCFVCESGLLLFDGVCLFLE